MGKPANFICTLLIALSVSTAAWTASEKEGVPFAFKNYMHQLYHSYAHTLISQEMNRADITEIHLKNMESSISDLPNHLPEYDMDGTVFNKSLFQKRLDELRARIVSLRKAQKTDTTDERKRIFGGIFRMCSACHEESKLSYLRLPRGTRVLFQDYMHRVTESFDLLEFFVEEGEAGAEGAEDHLKLIGYYLELLETTFPNAGPSGIILDRDAAVARIRKLQKLSGKMLDGAAKGSPDEVEDFRTTLNGFCVMCHEPERIK